MSKLLKLKQRLIEATTNDGVDQTRDLGNNSISVIQPDIVKKQQQEKQLMMQQQLETKKLIDTNSYKEEKDAAKAKVDAEVQKKMQLLKQIQIMM